MEKEFDNEIDALLRKEAGGRTITISEFAAPHLDADEISAFAENALPGLTKQKFAAHFADCDDCRKTLSSVIQLNSDTVTGKASQVAAPVAAGIPVPWYEKLFLFPNLAYVMGSLIVLFGGFLAFSVLQYSGNKAEISQISMDEAPAASGPSIGDGEVYYNTNTAAANFMNSAANTSMNAANASANSSIGRSPATSANTAEAVRDETPIATTDVDGGSPPAAPQPTPADTAVTMRKVENLPKAQEQLQDLKESERSARELKPRSVPSQAPGGAAKSKVPIKNESDNASSLDGQRSDQLSELKLTKPDSSAPSRRKQAGGRTFELRQNVWYDSAYRGQATINVRRDTDDYRKLSSGLRSIANGVSGTVVIVWNNKAYRIQ